MSDIKSKEAIREKHLIKNGLFVNKSPVGKAIQKSAYNAMDEWGRQQSIEFFKWYAIKMIGFLEYLKEYKPLIVSNEIESALKAFEGQTFDELYNLFLDHQLKQQV